MLIILIFNEIFKIYRQIFMMNELNHLNSEEWLTITIIELMCI